MSSNPLRIPKNAALRSVRQACPSHRQPAGVNGSAWSARSVVHPNALYHIEGEAARRGDGLYDRMDRSARMKY